MVEKLVDKWADKLAYVKVQKMGGLKVEMRVEMTADVMVEMKVYM